MKKLIPICLSIFLAGACASDLYRYGETFESVGLASEKHPCLKYELVTGNLVWGVLLFGTVAAPIYFFGWSLHEPVGEKYEGCFKDMVQGKRLLEVAP